MYRHTDKETGVGAWWAPFHVEWSFKYLGTGKKGGY
ncbi:MAG: iron transporter [Rhodospirillales bacterium]|nr:iron transporter [Rhodospirillales bacterium]